MPQVSSLGPQVTSPPVRVSTVTSYYPMPTRLPRPNPPAVDKLVSSPNSRSGKGPAVPYQGTHYYIVGSPPDSPDSAYNRRILFTTNNNVTANVSNLSQAEIDKNLAAVEARRKGVLGCLGKTGTGCSTPDGTNECDTVKCLENLLVGNLLDQDAKKLLCDMAKSSERALKRQVESAGDSLLDAADDLASAQAIKAPINTLNSALGKLDPGAVAKCFGAQQLINKAKSQLNKVNRTLSDAEKGVHETLAKKFNDGTEALQQFSVTPSVCSTAGAASLRSLL